jgi:hypothetical protein
VHARGLADVSYHAVSTYLSQMSRAMSLLRRTGRGRYALAPGVAPAAEATTRFGREERPETLTRLAERLLAAHGRLMTGRQLHEAMQQAGREVDYNVLLSTILPECHKPGALLVHYRGRPIRFGLASWKSKDRSAAPAPVRAALPEPPALIRHELPAVEAWKVLARRGTALHWEQIAAETPITVNRKGVNAALYRREYRDKVFTLVGPGTFGLVDWPVWPKAPRGGAS